MSSAFMALSVSHLRHWARKHDPTAKKLYPLKARGSAALFSIELLRAVSLSSAIILIAEKLSPWTAWLVVTIAIFLSFVFLSHIYLKHLGVKLLKLTSRGLLALTHMLKPVTLPLGKSFDRSLRREPIMLTRSELSQLLSGVPDGDSDLSTDEIRILKHVLGFSDKTVHDVMTKKSRVTMVKTSEALSPVVLDELHKSGHSRFPVSDENKAIVGILYVHDLIDIQSHVLVKDIMRPRVFFVNEDRELDHVLQAFLKTKQHLFMVVNNEAEVVGLVTIEDVVEQILGKPIADEFDSYESMDRVAEARSRTENTDQQTEENMVK